MLRFKKILLSLSLCLILLTGSVFATNMTKSDIIDYFDDNVSSNISVNTYVVGNFSDIIDGINSYISGNDLDYTLSNNYFCYYYNDDENHYEYYDLGDSIITSCDYSSGIFTLYLSNGATMFQGYSEEDYCYQDLSVNNISVRIDYPLCSNNFEDIFIYNSDNIFWSDSGSGGGLFDNIIAIMTSILAFIVPVATGLLAIPLFKFVIYASIALAIIYFVIILLKSYVGMKNLSIRFLGNYNGHKPTLKDGYNHYVNSRKK